MLEVALPDAVANDWATKCGGERMPKLHEQMGARGELGSKAVTSDVTAVRSLLVSGGVRGCG